MGIGIVTSPADVAGEPTLNSTRYRLSLSLFMPPIYILPLCLGVNENTNAFSLSPPLSPFSFSVFFFFLEKGRLAFVVFLLHLAGIFAITIALDVGAKTKDHTCAIVSGGGVKCWGSNSDGLLGIGNRTYATSPADVAGDGRPQYHLLKPVSPLNPVCLQYFLMSA
jgi:hypothetical protein